MIILGSIYLPEKEYDRRAIYFRMNKEEIKKESSKNQIIQSFGRIRSIIEADKEILKINNIEIDEEINNIGLKYSFTLNEAINVFDGTYLKMFNCNTLTSKEIHNDLKIRNKDIIEFLLNNNKLEKINDGKKISYKIKN
jgi:hypothetical protein